MIAAIRITVVAWSAKIARRLTTAIFIVNSTARRIDSSRPMARPRPSLSWSFERKAIPLTTAGQPIASQMPQEIAIATMMLKDRPGIR